MDLSFTIAAGPHQRSYSQVWVLQDSYFTVSDLKLPQPGGPGPCIYIPQEQGGPVIPTDTGFLLRCLLWLAGLQWRHSNTPLHGDLRERQYCVLNMYLNTLEQTKERTLNVTPKKHRRMTLLVKSSKHVPAIARQQPLYYLMCVRKSKCVLAYFPYSEKIKNKSMFMRSPCSVSVCSFPYLC
jgi:hypothetical protein